MMLYLPAFDVSKLALGTMTLATSGKPNVVIDLTALAYTAGDGSGNSPVLFHYDAAADFGFVSQDKAAVPRRRDLALHAFDLVLETAIITGMVAQSWVTPILHTSYSFDITTGHYTISYNIANLSVTWSTTLGRQLCGFAANLSGAQAYTGTITPYFAIAPTLLATSDNTPNYEPTGIASDCVADDGSGYGISREVAPTYRDWVQQYEIKAKSIRAAAVSTHPYSFQALFEDCRTQYPIIVYNGFGDTIREAFTLRAEGAQWSAEQFRAGRAIDFAFHIPFKTRVEGTVVDL